MKYIRKLPDKEELIEKYCISNDMKKRREETLNAIKNILQGTDKRKMIIIGPCSADSEDSVVEYAVRLADLQEKIADRFVIIPRVYTSKPRSNGMGYKGMLHNPYGDDEKQDIINGIIAMRKMHLHVIEQSGLFTADEILYPESVCYLEDLLAYAAVGARSVEDQSHRMIASGLEIPVGLKNPTGGNMTVLVNSILAAQHSQVMMYRGWEVETEGNTYAHGILRGYVDINNSTHPNYHYEDICRFYDLYINYNLKNPGVIIDCNHSNSNKQYREQIRIVEEVESMCKRNSTINNFVKGYMIESYIEEGNQLVGGGVKGKSITDACLGWNDTERLLLSL